MTVLPTKPDSTVGEGGDVWHDDLRVVPGDVRPAEVLHGDDDDVGQAGGEAAPEPQREEERREASHGVTWCGQVTGRTDISSSATTTPSCRTEPGGVRENIYIAGKLGIIALKRSLCQWKILLINFKIFLRIKEAKNFFFSKLYSRV